MDSGKHRQWKHSISSSIFFFSFNIFFFYKQNCNINTDVKKNCTRIKLTKHLAITDKERKRKYVYTRHNNTIQATINLLLLLLLRSSPSIHHFVCVWIVLRQDPLILLFWSFLIFFSHNGVEEVDRKLCKNHTKKLEGKVSLRYHQRCLLVLISKQCCTHNWLCLKVHSCSWEGIEVWNGLEYRNEIWRTSSFCSWLQIEDNF